MELPESAEAAEETAGLDRRNVLRRGAILGGALVWTVPAVQTLSGAAFATGSPICEAVLTFQAGPFCQKIVFVADHTCCSCVATQQGAPFNLPLPLAVATCFVNGSCVCRTPDCVLRGD